MILQDIKDKFRLSDAYEDWKDYRQLLTYTIIEAGGGDNKKTAAVIGAGYCNDIDIINLCRHFERITLVDWDREALAKVLNGLPKKDADKVETVIFSLTGIDESDISIFFEDSLAALKRCGKGLTREMFEEILMSGLDRLFKRMSISEQKSKRILPKRDIVICNGICSQLFSVISFFVRSVAGSIPDTVFYGAADVADRVENKLKSMNDKIVPVICSTLLTTANDYVIFGNEYSEKHPVEGAYQCIEEVRKNGSIVKEFEAVWSFNRKESVEYNMLLQICGVNKCSK